MKILIDTNVILDVLCDRTDFVESSSKIWKLCEVEKIDGYISGSSKTDKRSRISDHR